MDDRKAYLNATPMQREIVRRHLCDVLACLRAAYLSYQTSHWQVVGQSFYGNHLLFQRLYESVQAQVDQLAEKLVGYLGREVVGLDHQIKHIAGYTMRWSQIDCHHKRGLQSEADLQAALKRAYDGIKQVNAMTLGLDDWIMATANAHEENEYLLQQALTPVPGRRTASKPFRLSPKEINRADRSIPGRPFTIISRPQSDGSYMVAAVDPDTGMLVFEGSFEHADDKRGVADAIRRLNRHLDKNTGLATKMTSRSRHQHRASGAPTAEGDFYDNPEKKEVLEFADTGAISNSPEVAAAAAADGELDVPEAKAVAEADEAPPTPTEIKDEAGGSAVSTLNRFVVKTEDPAVEPAVKMNRDRMAAWLRELG